MQDVYPLQKPNTTVVLRDYQQELYDAILAAEADGYKRILVQSSTGSGKSLLQAQLMYDAAQDEKRSIFIVDGRNLVLQFPKTLSGMYGVHFQHIMADKLFTGASSSFVASVQTLNSWFFKSGAKFDLMILKEMRYVITDECRVLCTPSRQNVIEHFVREGATLVGFDATPKSPRIHLCYDILIQGKPTPWFIENGYLSPVVHYSPSTRDQQMAENLKLLGNSGGDYNQGQASELMNDKILVGEVVENYDKISTIEYGEHKPFVVACVDRKHAASIENAFLEADIVVRYIDANTPMEERETIFQQIASGEVMGIVSVLTMIYGVDLPALHIAINARPSKQLTLYLQFGGRILRMFDGNDTLPAKTHSVFIDHAVATATHGYLDDVFRWRLSADGAEVDNETRDEREAKESLDEVDITCANCAHVYKNSPKCPRCLHENIIELDEPNVSYINTDLVKAVREEAKRKVEAKDQAVYQEQWLASMKADIIADPKFANNFERINYIRMLAHRKFKVAMEISDVQAIQPTESTTEIKKYRISHNIARANGRRKR